MSFYKKKKKTLLALIIILGIIFVSSFCASAIQSSGFSVSVTDLRDQKNTGTITLMNGEVPTEAAVDGKVVSGILFKPDKASADNKLPAVVFTHGYLNSRELQLQNAIELSRRGFVVLVIDREGHGNYENTGETNALTATSGLYEAAKYLYNLDYVNRDKIGISGHSMGGYTTAMTLYWDSSATAAFDKTSGKATGKGLGIISAGLMQGWSNFIFADADVSVGNLKAQDDEFFYNSTSVNGDKTVSRQFLQSVDAAKFVKYQYTDEINIVNGGIYVDGVLTEVKEGEAVNGAFRVIYESDEIHPQNHCSVESSSHVINFFYSAFGTPQNAKFIASGSQTWWVKEAFSLIGLIGFFALLFPVVSLLMELPVFRSLKRKTTAITPEGLEIPVEDNRPALRGVRKNLFLWIPALVLSLFSGFIIHKMTTVGKDWFPLTPAFPQDQTNWLTMWALVCGVVGLCIVMLVWLFNGIINNVKNKKCGVATVTENPFAVAKMPDGLSGFIKTAFLASLSVGILYLVLNLTWLIFKVDFRIWTFDVKVFSVDMLPTMLRYAGIFGIFFVCNAIFNQSYNFKNMPEWLSILVNAFLNIFGIGLVILIQYVTFRSTGILWQPDMGLGYIVLMPMLPILIIATVISRMLYKKTGNIWLGAFINGLLFTIITVANTAASFGYILG